MQPVIFFFVCLKESTAFLFLDKQIYGERTSKTSFEWQNNLIYAKIKHDSCN